MKKKINRVLSILCILERVRLPSERKDYNEHLLWSADMFVLIECQKNKNSKFKRYIKTFARILK